MRARLSKSGIEYLDYSWGIWSGCRNLETGNCLVKACWAKGLALHYPKIYPDGFEPHYYPEAINSPMKLKKPSRISVGWVGDVIGYGLEYKEEIFDTIFNCPQHTFLFLTKNPERLLDWGKFPDNCFVGVSATNREKFISACTYLEHIWAKVKYLSLEPLLDWHNGNGVDIKGYLENGGISQVIIGSQTKPYRPPTFEAVQEIVNACDEAGVKVFLKGNLERALPFQQAEWAWVRDRYATSHSTNVVYTGKLRQEMPNG